MKTFQPWTTDDGNTLRLTKWPDHGPGHVLVDVDVFAPWEGLAFRRAFSSKHKISEALTGSQVLRDFFAHIDAHPQTHYTLRTRHPERVRECWPERCGTDCECECHEVPPPNRHIPCQAGGCWERPNVTLQIGPIHTQADADSLVPAGLECSDLMGSVEVYCQPTERIQFPLPCRESVFWSAVSRIVVSGGDQPMHPDWVRCLRDQATAANVPFVFESWGEWQPVSYTEGGRANAGMGHSYINRDTGELRLGFEIGEGLFTEWSPLLRVGRKHSGRLLDGDTWPGTEVT